MWISTASRSPLLYLPSLSPPSSSSPSCSPQVTTHCTRPTALNQHSMDHCTLRPIRPSPLHWRPAFLYRGAPACALHCTALHRTALHCTALHCTALHRTALQVTVAHTAQGAMPERPPPPHQEERSEMGRAASGSTKTLFWLLLDKQRHCSGCRLMIRGDILAACVSAEESF